MGIKNDYKLETVIKDGGISFYLPEEVIERASVIGIPSPVTLNLPRELNKRSLDAYILRGDGRVIVVDTSNPEEPVYVGDVYFDFGFFTRTFRNVRFEQPGTEEERAKRAYLGAETKKLPGDSVEFEDL